MESKCRSVPANKKFRTDGIDLCVKTWITFVDEKHFIGEAIKFSSTLSEYAKLAFFERSQLCPNRSRRNVFQSPSDQKYADEGVELFSQYTLHHRSHERENITKNKASNRKS